MNYGSEPADQVVRYSLEGAEFALRISGTAAKNFFIFARGRAWRNEQPGRSPSGEGKGSPPVLPNPQFCVA